MEITLEEALQLQKRLAKKLGYIKYKILHSSNDEEERDTLLDKYRDISKNLTELKVEIRKANSVYNDIYDIDELKKLEKLYKDVNKLDKSEDVRRQIEKKERKVKVFNCFTTITLSINIKHYHDEQNEQQVEQQ